MNIYSLVIGTAGSIGRSMYFQELNKFGYNPKSSGVNAIYTNQQSFGKAGVSVLSSRQHSFTDKFKIRQSGLTNARILIKVRRLYSFMPIFIITLNFQFILQFSLVALD